jgi:hypothetical protein
MTDSDVCGYFIRAPVNATASDTIRLEFASNHKTQVYVARKRDGNWLPHLDETDVTADGHVFTTADSAEFELNVVAYSNSFLKGHFVMTIWLDSESNLGNFSPYMQDTTTTNRSEEFAYIHENRGDLFEGWVEDESGSLIHSETGEELHQEDRVDPDIAAGGGLMGWHNELMNNDSPEVGSGNSEPVEPGYTLIDFVRWHRR